jgi:imidazolonepropionase-like amidohydrolase
MKELEELDYETPANSGFTKKELLLKKRELDKLHKSLGGIRNLTKVPSAIWVVDTKKEHLAIDEAHKLGIRVTAHIFNMDDAKGLMRANLDAFAHGVRDRDVDEETVAMFKARPNLVLNPNLPERGVKVDRSWMQAGMVPEEFDKLEKENIDRPKVVQEFHGIQARNLAKMNAAGVRIVMGTDGNRAWGAHEEMEDMVLAGMTPAQVLIASTRNGAEFLRIADGGTLEAGKTADFLVLDANLLEDIKNTWEISAVYLCGAAVDRSKPVP